MTKRSFKIHVTIIFIELLIIIAIFFTTIVKSVHILSNTANFNFHKKTLAESYSDNFDCHCKVYCYSFDPSKSSQKIEIVYSSDTIFLSNLYTTIENIPAALCKDNIEFDWEYEKVSITISTNKNQTTIYKLSGKEKSHY